MGADTNQPPPFSIDDAAALLSRTPATLDAWLRGLPPAWVAADEGPGTWTPFDVVGHLLHAERTNWMPRVRTIVEHGDSRAFEDFDRFAQLAASPSESLAGRLEAFAAARRDSLGALAAIGPADLDRRGRHPAFGAVTLRQLLAAWVAHDLDHLVQIARTMARRYTEAVGPWRQYLRVLRDPPG